MNELNGNRWLRLFLVAEMRIIFWSKTWFPSLGIFGLSPLLSVLPELRRLFLLFSLSKIANSPSMVVSRSLLFGLLLLVLLLVLLLLLLLLLLLVLLLLLLLVLLRLNLTSITSSGDHILARLLLTLGGDKDHLKAQSSKEGKYLLILLCIEVVERWRNIPKICEVLCFLLNP